jgi:uncharacterized integral membrane protein (TIGR00697 family)
MHEIHHVDHSTANTRHYKYYDLVMAGFVTVLLCSNIIGPGKVCQIWGFSFGAGNLFFPVAYIFGDILTEVYGYARARKVIWAGFGAMIFATFMSQVVLRMPADPTVEYNAIIDPALHTVFGNTWRIVAGSILAFWAGDFVNSFVLAKMKVWTEGRFLWMRTIGSTAAGQGVDSLIFYPIAFWGIWDPDTMVSVIAFNYALKVVWEAVNTPITYFIVGRLKRAEGVDWFDRDTDFTPFSLKD